MRDPADRLGSLAHDRGDRSVMVRRGYKDELFGAASAWVQSDILPYAGGAHNAGYGPIVLLAV